MFRAVVIAAAIAVSLGGLPQEAQPTGREFAKDAPIVHGWRDDQCRFRRAIGGNGWAHRELEMTLVCAVKHFPVKGGYPYAAAVVSCESGWGPGAYNPAGGYSGLFQIGPSEWRGWGHRFSGLVRRWELRASVFNPRSNIVLAVKHAHVYGWGGWSCP